MKPMYKLLKYILLFASALAVAAAVFIQTGYFKGLLKRVLTSQLGPIAGGVLTVEKLSGNIFMGVALEGVRLSGAGGQVFYAERIEASYSLPALAAGKIHLSRVFVSKPVFSLSQNAAGNWSYDGLFPAPKPPQASVPARSKGLSVKLGEVRVSGGRFLLKAGDRPETLDISGIELSASAHMKGDAANVILNSLSALGAKPRLAIKSASGKAAIKGNNLSITELRIGTEYSRVIINGAITELGNPVFDLNIDCPEVSLKDIGKLVPAIRSAGSLSSVIKLTGSPGELKIAQSLIYKSLKMSNEAVIQPAGYAVLLNSEIRGIKPCEVLEIFSGYESKTCPTGEIAMDIRFRAKGKNLDELSSSLLVHIHRTAFAGYTVAESSISASLKRRQAFVKGAIGLSRERFLLSARGRAGENSFLLNKLSVRSEHFDLSSRGVFGYDRNGPLDMTFQLKSAEIGLVSLLLPDLKVGGIVSSTATLKGTMALPVLSGELDGRHLRISEYSAESVKAKVDVKGFKVLPEGAAEVRIAGLRAGGGVFDNISVSARNSGHSGSIELSAERTSAVRFTLSAGFKEKAKGVYAIGISKLSASAGESVWSNDGYITIEASKDRLSVEPLSLSNLDQRISAKGRIGRTQNLDLKLSVRNADLSGINELAGLGLPLAGSLDADLAAGGSYLSPLITGTIKISETSLGGLKLGKIPAAFSYAEKSFRFNAHAENQGKTLFTAEGDIPVNLSLGPVKGRIAREGLRVSIKTYGLGLDIIPAFTEQVKSASGIIRADILATGNPLSPTLKGRINVSGGSLWLLATETEYSGIKAGIALDGNKITLRRLTMESGGGSAELEGKILLEGFIPKDAALALKCRDFKVMNTGLFAGNIDCDLKIKGLTAAGNVTVTQGIVNIPTKSRATMGEIEFVRYKPGGGTVIVPSLDLTPKLFKLLRLDVRLLVPGKTWVNGMGINAEIKGRLGVTKKQNGPIAYAGELETLRGVYKINERALTITEGKLSPRGSDFAASHIDAKASCRIGDADIYVVLGGTLENLIINFRSDPPMERGDIISYLVFGAPSNKLSQSQSSALKGTSYDILAGYAQKDIKGVVNRVVPIDELSLRPSEGSWGVGKNITDKLSAKYEWRSALDEKPQTVLDYKLDRHYSLNSQFGDPKTSGTDIFWKYGY